MTNQELNARAAEIMGWVSEPTGYFMPDKQEFHRGGWNPCENIAQTMLLFHKFGGMDILVSQDGKTFQAREPFSSHRKAEWYSEFEPTVERAILCACVAAAERKC